MTTTPAKYRKKPVAIEAIQWDGNNVDLIIEWSGGDGETIEPAGRVLLIHTLEGVMTAKLGDWIIKGVSSEFYPIKPEIFEATYEPVVASA